RAATGPSPAARWRCRRSCRWRRSTTPPATSTTATRGRTTAPRSRATPAGGPMALLEVRDLEMHYRGRRSLTDHVRRRPAPVVRAVDGVSFTVEPHEMLALVGESGCGKTSTAQTALRLLDPSAGSIAVSGRDITHLKQRQLRPLRRHMQLIYQDPYESLNPRYRVRRTIEEGLLVHGIGASAEERRARVVDALERVDLAPPGRYLERFPPEPSPGHPHP